MLLYSYLKFSLQVLKFSSKWMISILCEPPYVNKHRKGGNPGFTVWQERCWYWVGDDLYKVSRRLGYKFGRSIILEYC